MQNITDDSHGELRKILFVVPDGVHVEQTLGGVRMTAVAGVDHMHMRSHMTGNQMRRARFAMPYHE